MDCAFLACRATKSAGVVIKYASVTKLCDKVVALFVETYTKESVHRSRLPFSEASIFRVFERIALQYLHETTWVSCIDDVALGKAVETLAHSPALVELFPVSPQFSDLQSVPSWAAACHQIRSMDVYKVLGTPFTVWPT
jgi:hypothetical protein